MFSPLTLSLIAFLPVVSLTLVYAIVVGMRSWFNFELLPFLDSAK